MNFVFQYKLTFRYMHTTHIRHTQTEINRSRCLINHFLVENRKLSFCSQIGFSHRVSEINIYTASIRWVLCRTQPKKKRKYTTFLFDKFYLENKQIVYQSTKQNKNKNNNTNNDIKTPMFFFFLLHRILYFSTYSHFTSYHLCFSFFLVLFLYCFLLMFLHLSFINNYV